jgi:hypothetical protein
MNISHVTYRENRSRVFVHDPLRLGHVLVKSLDLIQPEKVGMINRVDDFVWNSETRAQTDPPFVTISLTLL